VARFDFGGVFAAWVVSSLNASATLGDGVTVVTLPNTSVTLDIRDAENGAVVNDFLDSAGGAVTSITVPTGSPYIPKFSGPDGVEALYVQASSGEWLPIPRYSTGATGGTLTQAQGDARYLKSDAIRPVVPESVRIRKMVWGGQSGHPFANLFPANTDFYDGADTTDVVIGSQAIVYRTKGLGLQTSAGQFGITAFDMSNGMPVIWVKVENPNALVDFKFYAGSSGSDFWTWDLMETSLAPRYLRDGEWVKLTLPMSNAVVASGTPNAAAITFVQLQAYDNNTGSKVTIHWGALGVAQESTYANGVFTYAFDDGRLTQFTLAAPYMARYGHTATSYMITETLWNHSDPGFVNYFDLDQAHELEDYCGWEMASHSYTAATHNAGYTAFTQAEQLADMRAARAYLNSQGFQAAEHFAYPLGARDTTVERSVRQTFASGRTLNGLTLESVPIADPVRVRCWAPDATVPLATYTAKIDRAVANGDWLIVLFHNLATGATGTDTETSLFEDVVDYVATSGIAVRKVSEVLR